MADVQTGQLDAPNTYVRTTDYRELQQAYADLSREKVALVALHGEIVKGGLGDWV